MYLNILSGSIYPEQANPFDIAQGSSRACRGTKRVEGLPFDFAHPSTRLGMSALSLSKDAQGKCALSVKIHLWAHLEDVQGVSGLP